MPARFRCYKGDLALGAWPQYCVLVDIGMNLAFCTRYNLALGQNGGYLFFRGATWIALPWAASAASIIASGSEGCA